MYMYMTCMLLVHVYKPLLYISMNRNTFSCVHIHYNSIVIIVTIHYSHRQEYGLQL